MKLPKGVSDWITLSRFKLGLMPKNEVVNRLLSDRDRFLHDLPKDERPVFRDIFSRLDSLGSVKNFNQFIQASTEFSKRLDYLGKRYTKDELGDAITEKMGFAASADPSFSLQGGNSWKYFINPFSLFSFFAENHWAVKAAIKIYQIEVLHDGFSLLYKNKTSKARVAEVEAILKRFNIPQLRMHLLKHFLVYGNALVMPHFSMIGHRLLKLEVIVMDHAMPIWDEQDYSIRGWDIWRGYASTSYPKEMFLHLKDPCLRYPDLGLPPCAAIALDLETDMAHSSLNHTIVQKAGLFGLIISVESPMDGLPNRSTERVVRRLKAEIQNEHSGIKGAGTVLVSSMIKGVHRLTEFAKFEAAFPRFREMCGRSVATEYQVPIDRLNLMAKSEGVYEASARSGASESLDKAIYATMLRIDTFINELILPLIGINDAYIAAAGRYGSMTLNGAKMSLLASQAGVCLTRNEHRVYFYGIPPKDPSDKSGYAEVDTSGVEAGMLNYAMQDPNTQQRISSTSEAEVPDNDDEEESEAS